MPYAPYKQLGSYQKKLQEKNNANELQMQRNRKTQPLDAKELQDRENQQRLKSNENQLRAESNEQKMLKPTAERRMKRRKQVKSTIVAKINRTHNKRAGRAYFDEPTKGGSWHVYDNGERVFVGTRHKGKK